jgi:uncharacterized protein (DUF58 family)
MLIANYTIKLLSVCFLFIYLLLYIIIFIYLLLFIFIFIFIFIGTTAPTFYHRTLESTGATSPAARAVEQSGNNSHASWQQQSGIQGALQPTKRADTGQPTERAYKQFSSTHYHRPEH